MVDLLVSERPRAVLDVGCGTGIVARLFAARGCDVVGVEADPRMAEVARRRGIVTHVSGFEDWPGGDRRFDLLVAGQAWHWVEPYAGADKAAAVLRPGGRIGLFWNQSFPGSPARAAIVAAYEHHAPDLGRQSVLLGRRDDALYEEIAGVLRADGRFTEVTVRTYGHDAVYSTDAWLDLASTHSDHRTLPAAQLRELLHALRTEIDRSGGQVPVHYETTLVTARTRPDAT